jgi:hypothetical protein
MAKLANYGPRDIQICWGYLKVKMVHTSTPARRRIAPSVATVTGLSGELILSRIELIARLW